ncbi:hypothetical protein V8E51_012267 [Hyaloscypha variabilis]
MIRSVPWCHRGHAKRSLRAGAGQRRSGAFCGEWYENGRMVEWLTGHRKRGRTFGLRRLRQPRQTLTTKVRYYTLGPHERAVSLHFSSDDNTGTRGQRQKMRTSELVGSGCATATMASVILVGATDQQQRGVNVWKAVGGSGRGGGGWQDMLGERSDISLNVTMLYTFGSHSQSALYITASPGGAGGVACWTDQVHSIGPGSSCMRKRPPERGCDQATNPTPDHPHTCDCDARCDARTTRGASSLSSVQQSQRGILIQAFVAQISNAATNLRLLSHYLQEHGKPSMRHHQRITTSL